MPLQPPPGSNYQSPLVSIPSRVFDTPLEGNRQVSMEIDWANMGITTGSLTSVYVNLQNNATINFSQICSIKVDNSQCGADVQIIFQDTSDTTDVAAYSPAAIFPVFTGATQFYVVANGADVADVTRIQLLNYAPYPVALPLSQEQNTAASGAMAIGNNTVTKQLVPTGINGTLEILQANIQFEAAQSSNSTANIYMFDGSSGPRYLWSPSAPFAISILAAVPFAQIIGLQNLNWRFTNGLSIEWQGLGGFSQGGIMNAFAAYRTP